MRYILLILVISCGNCSTLDKKIVKKSSIQRTFNTKAQPSSVQIPLVSIHWFPATAFGVGSFYVLLSSTNLIDWETLAITTDTNVVTAAKQREFYRLYDTNVITGESYWAGQTN